MEPASPPLRQAAAEPDSQFGGFTRILHTGEPDHLMDEIPTVVVEKGPKPDPGARAAGVPFSHRCTTHPTHCSRRGPDSQQIRTRTSPPPRAGAPPIQRPNSVIRWMEQAWPEEEYVLMLEPDHVLVKSVPLGGVALGHALGFFFSCAPAAGGGASRPRPTRVCRASCAVPAFLPGAAFRADAAPAPRRAASPRLQT